MRGQAAGSGSVVKSPFFVVELMSQSIDVFRKGNVRYVCYFIFPVDIAKKQHYNIANNPSYNTAKDRRKKRKNYGITN